MKAVACFFVAFTLGCKTSGLLYICKFKFPNSKFKIQNSKKQKQNKQKQKRSVKNQKKTNRESGRLRTKQMCKTACARLFLWCIFLARTSGTRPLLCRTMALSTTHTKKSFRFKNSTPTGLIFKKSTRGKLTF